MKTEIKELVAEGKVDEALDQLVAFLESKMDEYSPLYRAAQVAQSEFNQIKEKELQGVLTEDQIRLANNIAINKVLEILEQLERGSTAKPLPNRQIWWWYAAGGAVLTLVIVLLVRQLSPKPDLTEPLSDPGDSTQVVDIPAFTCPAFVKKAEYPIAIFQFTTLNPKDSITDQLLVEEIDAIFARNQYNGDAALVTKIKGSVDLSVAKAMIEKCQARMVIWGRVFDNNEIDLNFYEPQLNPAEQANLDSLLQFRNQGSFQASIKQAALIIAARVLVNNNSPGAVAVSEEAYDETMKGSNIAAKNAKKSNAESMATMTLANAHAKKKDFQKSIKLYDQILDKKPHDTVALRNRAIAQIKVNKIDDAVKSIDTLKRYQKVDDPVFLDKAGDELKERGFTRKGIEFKKDAKDAQLLLDQRLVKKIPQEQ
ncbi:MAG: tetratricopeptide repeat protein [Haliscomenobacter sp.]|uniref:tetratricopeptide repeat protein n=1 Tax=Haliscomenobacter sp. TaxID=2717303 RepID=UPI0029BAE0F6|nr:tetratricopeptide repeat protein [Haliscomenobacter sp.]MDX2067527.1 tetratricopeptide repeat protein [Haliscomenobacter sp.]